VREFLAQKEQMNVFGLKPMVSMVHEDVLEWIEGNLVIKLDNLIQKKVYP
jgi:hypothetical protein